MHDNSTLIYLLCQNQLSKSKTSPIYISDMFIKFLTKIIYFFILVFVKNRCKTSMFQSFYIFECYKKPPITFM